VFLQYSQHYALYADTSVLPTPVYLHGMEPGEEIAVDIEAGKTLIIKFLAIGDPHANGTRTVFFELNGQPREVTVQDQSLETDKAKAVKADPQNPKQIGSSMPGMVVLVAVQAGDSIAQGQKLMTLEAMKMETTIAAESAGKVATVHVGTGTQVEAGDLLITLA
jgi:pyruvate carboxylase